MTTPKSSVVYQLTLIKKDGTRQVLQENSTPAYCEAAALVSGKHPEVLALGGTADFECVRVMRVSGLPTTATTPDTATPAAPAPTPAAPAPAPTPAAPAPTPAAPAVPAGTWVTGQAVVAEAKLPLPAKGVAFKDPAFGITMYRVSDRADPPVGFARNDYSRRQAFNANNTRQLVAANDGWWHTYNAETFKYEKKLIGLAGDAEPQWHPTDPDILWYLPTQGNGMKVYELNVSTNTSKQIADLGPRLKSRWSNAMACWTGAEGSPSADGRYWGFMVDGDDWVSVGIVVWDRVTDTILSYLDTKGNRPDHVSMSPTGRYCVTSHVDQATGTVAWTRDLKTSKKLLGASQHSDLALDANGTDVYVAVDYGANDGDVFMVNLDTGVRTKLFASYIGGNASAFHFSGKAFDKPGWVLVSAQGDDPAKSRGWPYRKLFLQELKAGGRVLNVAFHRSVDGYYSAPVGSISRDGTRVAFNSSWGGTTDKEINAYQARLPAY